MDSTMEDRQETTIERSALFPDNVTDVSPMEIDPIVSLQRHFDFEVKDYTQPTESQLASDENQNPVDTEFNLFSTGSGPAKISLAFGAHPDLLVNRRRPKEHYFTDPNDTERISRLMSVAITASQVIESSRHPWAAKQNPRLLKTISANPEKVKKRRKPSKKERDYKKKLQLEEEKRAKNEKRYEKYLKYGQGQNTARGSSQRGLFRGRGGLRGRGRRGA